MAPPSLALLRQAWRKASPRCSSSLPRALHLSRSATAYRSLGFSQIRSGIRPGFSRDLNFGFGVLDGFVGVRNASNRFLGSRTWQGIASLSSDASAFPKSILDDESRVSEDAKEESDSLGMETIQASSAAVDVNTSDASESETGSNSENSDVRRNEGKEEVTADLRSNIRDLDSEPKLLSLDAPFDDEDVLEKAFEEFESSQKDSTRAESKVKPKKSEDVPPVPASKSGLNHPWPEWIRFIQHVESQGYFKKVAADIGLDDESKSPMEDASCLKKGLLTFGRDRDDIFRYLSKQQMRIIAAYGCPDLERKAQNAAKRLRLFFRIQEVSSCLPCPIKTQCMRAFANVTEDSPVSTHVILRLIMGYAKVVSGKGNAEGIDIPPYPKHVTDACLFLIDEFVTLTKNPRDPNLPRPVPLPSKSEKTMQNPEIKKAYYEQIEDKIQHRGFNKVERIDLKSRHHELLPGDWLCPRCNYKNFARNYECRGCRAPKPSDMQSRDRDTDDRFGRSERPNRYDRSDRLGRSSERSFDRDFRSERSSDRDRNYDRGGRYDDYRASDRRSVSRSRFGLNNQREEWDYDALNRGSGRGGNNEDEDEDYDTRKPRRSSKGRNAPSDFGELGVDEGDEDEDDDFEFSEERKSRNRIRGQKTLGSKKRVQDEDEDDEDDDGGDEEEEDVNYSRGRNFFSDPDEGKVYRPSSEDRPFRDSRDRNRRSYERDGSPRGNRGGYGNSRGGRSYEGRERYGREGSGGYEQRRREGGSSSRGGGYERSGGERYQSWSGNDNRSERGRGVGRGGARSRR